MKPSVEQTCINTIRILAADMVQQANSGHPGAPMGCAPLAHILFSRHLRTSGRHPGWMGRDRFVLSNGHACALQYILLHLRGFPMTMDDLKRFRQLDSKTPGHPENFLTDGVEVTTGPLGQGIANAVGLAIAEANLAATFNKPNFMLIDNFTFVVCGDGCLQEGVTAEALSLAGHLGLGRLIVIYDDNCVTIDGETDLAFTEDVSMRFRAYGFHVEEVEDGNTDIESFHEAVVRAKATLDRPSLIRVKTTIGFGATHEGTEKVHGAPLGPQEVKRLKSKWGFDPEVAFYVPPEVYSFYRQINAENEKLRTDWEALFSRYATEYPEQAAAFQRRLDKRLDFDLKSALPKFSLSDPEIATRKCSEHVLNAIGNRFPDLIGGSADLTSSNLTKWKGSVDFQRDSPEGRYIRFGVREHAMAAICNGIAAYGCFLPFCATFLNFIGYAQGALRLSALSKLQVIYIMTHDSIGLGEDGPTHQPIEILPLLRATPDLLVLRPADGNEVSGAYYAALSSKHTPSVICLSRQNLPQLPNSSIDNFMHGAYIIKPFERDRSEYTLLVLVASGSEVSICLEAAGRLERQEPNISVQIVSMPSFELFERQPNDYKTSMFPHAVTVVSVEASSTFGWSRYAHYHIGMTTFGASGPYKKVYERFHLDAASVCRQAFHYLSFASKGVPPLPIHYTC